MPIDLHVHSNASDGSFPPLKLIDLAIENKIHTLALCDHDTTAGLKSFISYQTIPNFKAIPGIELSVTWKKGNCHILGLGVSLDYSPLESVLKEIRESRGDRNIKIVKKLNNLGINISIEDIKQIAGGDVIARPHFARVMLNKGYVATTQEAFDKFLAKDAPAYVDRYHLEPEKAVLLLKEANALPILAHPSQLQLEKDELETFLKKIIPSGLRGIEVFTPYTSDKQIDEYGTLAEKYRLFITGGSDFHGESKPDHYLGYYRQDKMIPDSCSKIALNF